MTVDNLIDALTEMRKKTGNVEVRISVSDQMGGWIEIPEINVELDRDIDSNPYIIIIDNDELL